MGSKIRRVPADWVHPKQPCPHSPWVGGCEQARRTDGTCFIPLMDRTFEEATAEYERERADWDAGKRPDYCDPNYKGSFEDWDGPPPTPGGYRPAYTSEPTHYQMYETVSEGTPLTPVFATPEELIDHLVEHGTFWDARPWSRENAEAFVGAGWMPSMVLDGSGRKLEPKDYLKKS